MVRIGTRVLVCIIVMNSLKLATGLGGADGAVSGGSRRPRSLLLRHRALL